MKSRIRSVIAIHWLPFSSGGSRSKKGLSARMVHFMAIRRMRRALEEVVIEGYPTTADLCHLILYHPDFVKGKYDTSFLERHLEALLQWEGEGER